MEWATPAPARSAFVTVVAWIFIALDGMGLFISLLQNIVVNTVFSFDRLHEAEMQAQSKMHVPPFFFWIFGHIRLFLGIFLIWTLIKFVSAIGLLRRQNWARLVFIGFLALGIAWNIAAIVLQQFFVSSMLTAMPPPPNAPKNFNEVMQGMLIGIRVFSAIFAIGFSVLLAWMIKKLLSPVIVAEFA